MGVLKIFPCSFGWCFCFATEESNDVEVTHDVEVSNDVKITHVTYQPTKTKILQPCLAH